MADDFFQADPQGQDGAAESTTVKIGEKEYSQEDLAKIVGLGEIAFEAEQKWNTPVNRVFPEFTKATQKVSELEKKLQELEAKQAQPQTQDNAALSEEQKNEVKRQLAEMGFVTKEEAAKEVEARMAAKDLLQDVNSVITENKGAGNPTTSAAELLQYMQDTGIKNPAKAYKDMFENELDAIKEAKLAGIKGSGMSTISSSTAGSKQPAPAKTPSNFSDLSKAVNEALGLTS